MIDSQQPQTSRVSVEDLIRLKRAERPPAEFWVEFERSLRAKQLAAIVEKRSWWRSFGTFSRWTMPLGAAAAALSISFVALNRSQSGAPKSVDLAKTEQAQKPAAPALPAVATETFVASTNSHEHELPATVTVAEHHTPAVVNTAVQSAIAHSADAAVATAAAAAQVGSVTEQIAGIVSESHTPQDAATAQFASVTEVETPSVSAIGAYFDRALGSFGESSAKDKTSVVEPLSQVTAPRDARRARLLAFTSTVDNRSPQYSDSTSVVRSRERITSHLNEEALYDSLHRLGLKGNLVSIQF
ncbi:MAG TPA: hypothetical protein VFT72_03220 [Opitutaceae bacterium]|nr:hypothetical protein [Opitutaceae bacterium]